MQCNTIQYNTIQYNTIQCNTIQYNAMQSLSIFRNNTCGTYEQLGYYPNNFDDFGVSILIF